MEGTPYSPNVLRKFLRCKRVETPFPSAVVSSINICSDSVRGSDHLSKFEMTYNSNHCRFIQEIEDKSWKISEMYVDCYRMLDPYLTKIFRKGFSFNMIFLYLTVIVVLFEF